MAAGIRRRVEVLEQWAEAFEDGRCPLCGAEPVRIKVVYDGEAE